MLHFFIQNEGQPLVAMKQTLTGYQEQNNDFHAGTSFG